MENTLPSFRARFRAILYGSIVMLFMTYLSQAKAQSAFTDQSAFTEIPSPVNNLRKSSKSTSSLFISIEGTVFDEGGNPLPGVSVLIKGTSFGTITDLDGRFVLDNVDNDDVLVFSYMGFLTQEIAVAPRENVNRD
jgi:hypothetical protein